MTVLLADTLIEEVVLTHALDGAFLWMQRERACTAPNYNLRELASLDDSLAAHLEGLRLAGLRGLSVYTESLGSDPGDAFVLALVSAYQDVAIWEKTIDSLADEPETLAGVIAALSWLPFDMARPLIDRWLDVASVSRRYIAIGAAIRHRYNPPGTALHDAVVDEDANLRALALWGVGELGRADLLLPLQHSSRDADLACRYQARRAALLLQVPNMASALIEATLSGRREADDACRFAMRHCSAEMALDLHAQLASQESTLRLAVIGAGATGDPAYVPWILDAMTRPECARPAIDAFVSIVGVDVESENLLGSAPEDFAEGPTAEPADSEVEVPEDLAIPWPRVEAVVAWWRQHGSRFGAGTSYLMGQARDTTGLTTVLTLGNQRLRGIAAFELARLGPDAIPTFDTSAPASHQFAQLSIL